MDNKNFTTTILVDQTTKEVFNAVTNVRGWWSENIDGNTDKLNAEFLYHYKDVHICKMRIVEFVPDKKVVWLVLENHFNFIKDQSEWKGNKIVFIISENGKQTQLHFTHEGLTSDYECYNVCQDAWTSYIHGSLKNLITTGQGNPNTKEDDSLNKTLIEKWGLPKK
ncbi:MAG TPA: SRPBCC domain-containing protein [Chryseolinea sp.]|nr:SRPBCC domain-containing protein [Chryseolinea sp.]